MQDVEQLGGHRVVVGAGPVGAVAEHGSVDAELAGRGGAIGQESHRGAAGQVVVLGVGGAHHDGAGRGSGDGGHGCRLKKASRRSCTGADSGTAISGPYTPWARRSSIGTWA